MSLYGLRYTGFPKVGYLYSRYFNIKRSRCPVCSELGYYRTNHYLHAWSYEKRGNEIEMVLRKGDVCWISS